MSRPKWWGTLQEARRQACVAIDFYNRPGDRRSLDDFIVHMHLAWQDLLHADLERSKVNIFFKESNGYYKRDKHGNKVSWDLTTCLKKEFPDNDPTRANVEFFVGLRNVIEHRFQDSVVVATAPHAHALVLNFERELVTRFGSEESLAAELRFPVFVQALTPEGVEEQRRLRRGIPLTTRTYITEFETALDAAILEDDRFEYRVMLAPVKGPKSEADLAFTFVNTNTLTPEQLAELQKGNKVGTVLVAEKQRSVGLVHEMLPTAAATAIRDRIPFNFSVNDFTKLRHSHNVGPHKGESHKTTDRGDGTYCIYSAPTKTHVYTTDYVERCVKELVTAEKFEATLGFKPTIAIVTKLKSKKAGNTVKAEQATA